MKVYDLQCGAGHGFEGWFGSKADFLGQRKRGLLECPSCGNREVRRVPSATRVNVGASEPAKVPTTAAKQNVSDADGRDPMAVAQMLYSRMVDELLTKTEDVGSAFPEEARKIHYKEVEARAIRGQATQEEHDALVDEGIPVGRFPLPSKRDLN